MSAKHQSLLSIAGGAALLLSAGHASAQGLLSIGADGDFPDDFPLTLTLGVGAGWDSNINTGSTDEIDSAWYQAGAGVSYGWSNKITSANLGLAGSVIKYDESGNFESEDYNGRLSLSLSHAASPRLTLGGSAYVAYEAEPDFEVGVASARRSGQYFYFNGDVSATYALTRRLSVNAGYNFGTILYDEGEASDTEDRITQNLSVNLQYGYSRSTSLILGARWGKTSYDVLDADFDTYSLYVGADHSFSPRLTGSARVGGQTYDNGARDVTETSPFLEASLRYLMDRSTSLRWYHRLGYEGSELSSFNSRYAYRTGVTATRQLNRRTTANLGVNYAYSDLSGSEELGDITDHQLFLDAGITYRIFRNIDVNATYTYITLSSDNDFRSFDRQRVSLGASATF